MKMISYIICLLVLASCSKSESGGGAPPPPPASNARISIADSKQERSSTTVTNMIFVVNVENPGSQPIAVKYTTTDGTAKAGDDYTALSGTLNIPANQHNATIQVALPADSTREDDRTFYLQLGEVTNAKISGTGKAAGTIISNGTYLPVQDAGYASPLTWPGYELKWSDDFDGKILNSASWTHETGGNGWGNNELENYTTSSKNLFLSGGYLVIEARKETMGNNAYTSARIITSGKKEFTYGRVDIRAKLPKGKGVWPALWMLGANIKTVPWPASGEIDIMELLGHEPNKTYGTIHWGNAGAPSTHIGKDYVLPSGDFSQTFHVFSLVWEADKIEWYVDNVKFYTALSSEVTGNNPFDKPFFFIFNVAVGGNWPGNPDTNTGFPQRMIVDYIRVFQKP